MKKRFNSAGIRLIIMTLFLLFTQSDFAQIMKKTTDAVKYSNSGFSFTFTPLINDNDCYLIVSMVSGENTFTKTPIIKIRTFGDQIVELEGEIINDKKSTAGIIVSGVFLPVESYTSIAQFKIDEETFQLLKMGIKKFHVMAVPRSFTKEFKKDKFGFKIYDMLYKAKERKEEF